MVLQTIDTIDPRKTDVTVILKGALNVSQARYTTLHKLQLSKVDE